MAPEIIKTMGKHDTTGFAQLTPSVDTYAFGIIMWEALMMLEPWSNVKVKWSHEIFEMVEKGKRPPVDRAVLKASPKGFEEIMESCWDQDPSRRPTFSWIIRGIQDVRVAWLKRKERNAGYNLPRRRVPSAPRTQKAGTPLPPVPRKPRGDRKKKRAPPTVPRKKTTDGIEMGVL
jgi:serine/threonine protein kinase